MSNHVKYFATHSRTGMRLAGLPSTRTASPCCHASRAVAGLAPVRGFASVLLSMNGRHCTPSDNLPQLPQLAFEKLGQRKPNNGGLPRLPQPAPPVFDMNRMEKEAARRVWGAGRELNSRHKTGCATQPCNFERYSLASSIAGTKRRIVFPGGVIQNLVNSLCLVLQLKLTYAKR